MKTLLKTLLALLLPLSASAQSEFTLKNQVPANPENQPAPVFPVPSDRQVMWQETEFYGFFHYGMNTYTNLEWGNGDEAETKFAPTQAPNPRQWLEAVKAAGMKGGIAVVKHHDGFCLWPTETTTHNVTNSGNEYGKNTNIPRDFAAAAKDLGLKYGFYISPWDRNSALYGTSEYVSKVFLRQCAELAQYGTDQFEMWFDGANGGSGYYGGANETRSVDRPTYYDVPNLRDSVHKVCPNCVMWGVGGEARWIGNESGWAGQTNWSPMNYRSAMDGQEYGEEDGWYWFPGESDAKGTDQGWFWHSNENPKSSEAMYRIYLETVGRNCCLILNCPPNTAGVLPDATVTQLAGMGKLLQTRLGTDLAPQATIKASEERTAGTGRDYLATNMIDGDKETYWATNDGNNTATITLEWPEAITAHYVSLMEFIRLGQRIQSFTVETSYDGSTWTKRGGSQEMTTVGYKRIIPLSGSTSSYGNGFNIKYMRITITGAKSCPTLHTLSVF